MQGLRGLIGDLGCKNTPFKAEYSIKSMFVDSHRQNSKNEWSFCQRCKVLFGIMEKYVTAEYVIARRGCNCFVL